VRSTRFYLTIAFLAASALGAFWVVRAQEGPRWEPPAIVPADERAAEKKAPIKIGGQRFNEKPKVADPSMIIPAAAYETPRPVKVEKGSEIVLTGGTQILPEKKDDKTPTLPDLPGLIPDLPQTKLLVQPELPAPLPPPLVVEPTKALIVDPTVKKELPPLPPMMLIPPAEEKKELFSAPKVVLEPKQTPLLDVKKPTTLIAPDVQGEEPLKSFVRVRSEQDAAPVPGLPTPKPHNDRVAPILVPKDLVMPLRPLQAPSSVLTLQTPSLTVEKRAGVGPTYQIVVRNVGAVAGQNVRVEDELPAGAKVLAAEPMPTMQGDKAVWVIPEIAVQREIVLQITIQAIGNVPPHHHTSIFVSATSQTHTAAVPIRHEVNPLVVQFLGPFKAAVGKPVALQIRVKNQSDQAISGIKLYGVLPEGLDTPEGRKIEGPEDGMVFQAGETKTLKMPANTVKPGRHVVLVKAATSTGIEATDSATIDITADGLMIQQAPQVKLLPGREGDLRIEVINSTGRALHNVSVVNRLPDGLDFIQASDAGLYQANSRTVYWTIKDLPESKTQTLYVRVQGAKAGQYQNTVTVKAEGVPIQTSTGQVVLEGIADLTLRVVGHEGPVYVGREVTYEIQVQNRGMSGDQNVQLQVQFPAGLTPKSAQGPMRHSLEKQTILFEPIAAIGAQGQALYKVSAIAQTPGDQRVRFAIVSEQVRNPIQREISTMVYKD
jgi:uncharacterized repeat protein (TIGR01451 family)